jgi:hypothetical protein
VGERRQLGERDWLPIQLADQQRTARVGEPTVPDVGDIIAALPKTPPSQIVVILLS